MATLFVGAHPWKSLWSLPKSSTLSHEAGQGRPGQEESGHGELAYGWKKDGRTLIACVLWPAGNE